MSLTKILLTIVALVIIIITPSSSSSSSSSSSPMFVTADVNIPNCPSNGILDIARHPNVESMDDTKIELITVSGNLDDCHIIIQSIELYRLEIFSTLSDGNITIRDVSCHTNANCIFFQQPVSNAGFISMSNIRAENLRFDTTTADNNFRLVVFGQTVSVRQQIVAGGFRLNNVKLSSSEGRVTLMPLLFQEEVSCLASSSEQQQQSCSFSVNNITLDYIEIDAPQKPIDVNGIKLPTLSGFTFVSVEQLSVRNIFINSTRPNVYGLSAVSIIVTTLPSSSSSSSSNNDLTIITSLTVQNFVLSNISTRMGALYSSACRVYNGNDRTVHGYAQVEVNNILMEEISARDDSNSALAVYLISIVEFTSMSAGSSSSSSSSFVRLTNCRLKNLRIESDLPNVNLYIYGFVIFNSGIEDFNNVTINKVEVSNVKSSVSDTGSMYITVVDLRGSVTAAVTSVMNNNNNNNNPSVYSTFLTVADCVIFHIDSRARQNQIVGFTTQKGSNDLLSPITNFTNILFRNIGFRHIKFWYVSGGNVVARQYPIVLQGGVVLYHHHHRFQEQQQNSVSQSSSSSSSLIADSIFIDNFENFVVSSSSTTVDSNLYLYLVCFYSQLGIYGYANMRFSNFSSQHVNIVAPGQDLDINLVTFDMNVSSDFIHHNSVDAASSQQQLLDALQVLNNKWTPYSHSSIVVVPQSPVRTLTSSFIGENFIISNVTLRGFKTDVYGFNFQMILQNYSHVRFSNITFSNLDSVAEDHAIVKQVSVSPGISFIHPSTSSSSFSTASPPSSLTLSEFSIVNVSVHGIGTKNSNIDVNGFVTQQHKRDVTENGETIKVLVEDTVDGYNNVLMQNSEMRNVSLSNKGGRSICRIFDFRGRVIAYPLRMIIDDSASASTAVTSSFIARNIHISNLKSVSVQFTSNANIYTSNINGYKTIDIEDMSSRLIETSASKNYDAVTVTVFDVRAQISFCGGLRKNHGFDLALSPCDEKYFSDYLRQQQQQSSSPGPSSSTLVQQIIASSQTSFTASHLSISDSVASGRMFETYNCMRTLGNMFVSKFDVSHMNVSNASSIGGTQKFTAAVHIVADLVFSPPLYTSDQNLINSGVFRAEHISISDLIFSGGQIQFGRAVEVERIENFATVTARYLQVTNVKATEPTESFPYLGFRTSRIVLCPLSLQTVVNIHRSIRIEHLHISDIDVIKAGQGFTYIGNVFIGVSNDVIEDTRLGTVMYTTVKFPNGDPRVPASHYGFLNISSSSTAEAVVIEMKNFTVANVIRVVSNQDTDVRVSNIVLKGEWSAAAADHHDSNQKGASSFTISDFNLHNVNTEDTVDTKSIFVAHVTFDDLTFRNNPVNAFAFDSCSMSKVSISTSKTENKKGVVRCAAILFFDTSDENSNNFHPSFSATSISASDISFSRFTPPSPPVVSLVSFPASLSSSTSSSISFSTFSLSSSSLDRVAVTSLLPSSSTLVNLVNLPSVTTSATITSSSLQLHGSTIASSDFCTKSTCSFIRFDNQFSSLVSSPGTTTASEVKITVIGSSLHVPESPASSSFITSSSNAFTQGILPHEFHFSSNNIVRPTTQTSTASSASDPPTYLLSSTNEGEQFLESLRDSKWFFECNNFPSPSSESMIRSFDRNYNIIRDAEVHHCIIPTSSKTLSKSFSKSSTLEIPKPKEVSPLRQVSQDIMSAAAFLRLVTTPTAVLSAARSRAVLQIAQNIADGNCGGSDQDLEKKPDFSSSPFGMYFKDDGGYASGAVIGNLLFLLTVFVGTYGSFVFYHRVVAKRARDPRTGKRLPPPSLKESLIESKSWTIVFFAVLMVIQPTLNSSLLLASLSSIALSWKVVSVLIWFILILFVYCILSMIVYLLFKRKQHEIFVKVSGKLRFEKFVDKTADALLEEVKHNNNDEKQNFNKKESSSSSLLSSFIEPLRKLLVFLVGPEGEWHLPKYISLSSSATIDDHNPERSSRDRRSSRNKQPPRQQLPVPSSEQFLFYLAEPALEGYSERFPKFLIFDLLIIIILALAIFAGIQNAGCFAMAITVIVALFLYTLLTLFYRPFVERFMRICTPVLSLFDAVLLLTVVIEIEEDIFGPLLVVVATLQLVVSIVTFVAFLFPVFGVIWVIKRNLLDKKETNRDEDDHDGRGGSTRRRQFTAGGRSQHRGLEHLLSEDGDGNEMLNSDELLLNPEQMQRRRNSEKRRRSERSNDYYYHAELSPRRSSKSGEHSPVSRAGNSRPVVNRERTMSRRNFDDDDRSRRPSSSSNRPRVPRSEHHTSSSSRSRRSESDRNSSNHNDNRRHSSSLPSRRNNGEGITPRIREGDRRRHDSHHKNDGPSRSDGRNLRVDNREEPPRRHNTSSSSSSRKRRYEGVDVSAI